MAISIIIYHLSTLSPTQSSTSLGSAHPIGNEAPTVAHQTGDLNTHGVCVGDAAH